MSVIVLIGFLKRFRFLRRTHRIVAIEIIAASETPNVMNAAA